MLTSCKHFLQKNFSLIALIIFAAILRFYKLSDLPPSLNWDEVSHGYNAYSILKTGRDEWGNFMPIIFRAYGDYKLPVYIYLTAVSEFFFGLTPFAVRFVSALSGVGTVIFTYFLTKEIFPVKKINPQLALTAALLVAIEPWSLFLSRAALEANLALFLFVSGIYFFFRFLNFHTLHFLLPTTILLGLTVWTYNSYRIFTPLIVIAICFIYKEQLIKFYSAKKRLVYLPLLILSLFLIPMFYQLLTSVGQARYSNVQMLDDGTIARIEQKRNEGGSRYVYNKVTYFATGFTKNYISHFSPEFLFLEGGNNYQFSVPGRGVMYPINIIFFYLGFAAIFWKVLRLNNEYSYGRRNWVLVLIWLLLAPIPSSLTREAPHVLRTITLLPIPMILTSVGLLTFLSWFKNKKNTYILLFTSYFIFITLLTLNYLKSYFKDYRLNYSQSWQYGYGQVADYIKVNYANYDKIVITKKYGEPHEFLLFFLKLDPKNYRDNQNLNRFYQSNWYWVDGFDKFYFINDWEISENNDSNIPRSLVEKDLFKLESDEIVDCYGSNAKCLLVTSPDNYPSGWTKLDSINFLNGKPVFEIYEN